jgi:hypothetical protein
MQEQRQIFIRYERIENIKEFHLMPRRYCVFAGLEHPLILAAFGANATSVNNASLVDFYSHISPSME